MKSIFVLTLMLVAGFAGTAMAENTFGVAWNIGLPTGNTNEFTPGLSLRGVTFEGRTFVRPDVAWGGSIGWNVFNEETSGSQVFNNVTYTGKRWDYINAVPIHLAAFKYFGTNRREPRWYMGMSAGTTFIETRTEVSLYAIQEQNWHLALAPEVGVQLPWSSFIGYVSLRFHHAFEAGDVVAQDWFELKLGFGLD